MLHRSAVRTSLLVIASLSAVALLACQQDADEAETSAAALEASSCLTSASNQALAAEVERRLGLAGGTSNRIRIREGWCPFNPTTGWSFSPQTNCAGLPTEPRSSNWAAQIDGQCLQHEGAPETPRSICERFRRGDCFGGYCP